MTVQPRDPALAELFEKPVQVFDLDGTLIDTIVDLTVALNLALYEQRLPPIDRELVRASLHGGIEASARAALVAANAPEVDFAPLLEAYRRHYRAISGKFSRVYRGVPSVLARLRSRGARLAICSNKAEAEARALLARKGLARYFEVVVGADTCGLRKPAPEPLLMAISRLQGRPESSLFTGDSHIDIDCASAAGVDFALFDGGYGHHALEARTRFSQWHECFADAIDPRISQCT